MTLPVFKEQDTDLNSFKRSEKIIYDFLAQGGYSHAASEVVAHVFTQYMLNYWTFEGAVNKIADAGISLPDSRKIVEMFERTRAYLAQNPIPVAPPEDTRKFASQY